MNIIKLGESLPQSSDFETIMQELDYHETKAKELKSKLDIVKEQAMSWMLKNNVDSIKIGGYNFIITKRKDSLSVDVSMVENPKDYEKIVFDDEKYIKENPKSDAIIITEGIKYITIRKPKKEEN